MEPGLAPHRPTDLAILALTGEQWVEFDGQEKSLGEGLFFFFSYPLSTVFLARVNVSD